MFCPTLLYASALNLVDASHPATLFGKVLVMLLLMHIAKFCAVLSFMPGPKVIKLFMPSSAETKVYSAHKC